MENALKLDEKNKNINLQYFQSFIIKDIQMKFENHSKQIDACSCRCISHCSCDCDKCGITQIFA